MIEQPWWLLLLLVLVFFGFLRKNLHNRLPFQFLLITIGIFLVLGLCKISILVKPEPREFVVLIDNSKSMKLSLNNNLIQIQETLKSELSTLKPNDKINFLTFNENADFLTVSENFSGNWGNIKKIISEIEWTDKIGTNLLTALETSTAMFSKHQPTGLIVITDCGFTDEIKKIDEQLLILKSQNVKAKLINLGRNKIRNVGFIEITSPQKVFFDEIALFQTKLKSEFNTKVLLKALFQFQNKHIQEVKTQLFFNDTPLQKNSDGSFNIKEQVVYSALAWGKVSAKSGILSCKFKILTDDEISSDNSAQTQAFIGAEKSVLVFTNDGNKDYISEFLRLNFTDVMFEIRAAQEAFVNSENYLGYRAIIFSDVNKNQFRNPVEVFHAVTTAVENYGVNFAMIGGRNSFAPGGFLKTEIERILPIELDPNKNKRRAIVVLIDRSESMNKSIGSSTRIGVVGEAAKKFINNLDKKDQCAFISFADSADTKGETVQLAQLTPEYKQKISDRINVLGKSKHLFGRTNIEDAIKKGLEKLQIRDEKIKALLMFTDGEPTLGAKTVEEFRPIIKKFADKNIFLGLAVAGKMNKFFKTLSDELKNNGSIEFLQQNWDVNTAFNNALLKASGKIIETGKIKILNPESQVILNYPPLKGYVRCLLKESGNPELVAMTDKKDPFIVNWWINDALSSAFLIPFNDYDLIWEKQIPKKIANLMKDNFFRLFVGKTLQFNVDVINKDSKYLVKIQDSQEDIIRKLQLKFEKDDYELKPSKPGEYETLLDLKETSIAVIHGKGIQQIPVVLQPKLSTEYQNINLKKKLLLSLFEKHFTTQLKEKPISDSIPSRLTEGFELTKIFNLLALINLLFWAFLFAFKPRK